MVGLFPQRITGRIIDVRDDVKFMTVNDIPSAQQILKTSCVKGTRTHGLARFNSHHFSDAAHCPQTLGRMACRPGQFRPLDDPRLPPTTLGPDGPATRSVSSIRIRFNQLDFQGEDQ